MHATANYPNAFLAIVALMILTTSAAHSADQQPAKKGPKLAPQQTAIFVSDLHCSSCAKKIARGLYKIKGVSRVSTSVIGNYAIVTPQKDKRVAAPLIWSVVQSTKFEPVKLIGPDGVYVADKKTKKPQKIAEAPKPSRR